MIEPQAGSPPVADGDAAALVAAAILDYSQSGERFRGRTTIAAQRGAHPADRHFTVLRIGGSGDLWVSEWGPLR